MKKIILLTGAVVFSMVLVSLSRAATVGCGATDTNCQPCGEGCYWSYDTETKELTLSGNGTMMDFELASGGATNVPWKPYINQIKSVNVAPDSSLHNVGQGAFMFAGSLKSFNMPNLTSIGDSAFAVTSSLTSIDLSNVTSIGRWAFSDASSLTSIDLSSATSIGDAVFSGASRLGYVRLPENIDNEGFILDENGNRMYQEYSDLPDGEMECIMGLYGVWRASDSVCIAPMKSEVVGIFSGTQVEDCGRGGSCNICTDSSRAGYDATKSVYKPAGESGTSGTCVSANDCGTGYSAINGLCSENSSGSQVSEASCYANGQVYWDNACVDEYPFAKKHWTPAEAAQYLKDTDNVVIMTFKVNR